MLGHGDCENAGWRRQFRWHDICGNTYRFVVQFNYAVGIARVRFAGTHEEYDHVDVTKV